MTAAVAMVLAVVFDVAFGEPRRFHPVSGIGKTLGWFRRGTRLPRPWQRTVVGTCGLASVAAAVGALAYAGERLLSSALALPLLALALKPSFSIRRLFEVGNLVEAALGRGDIDDARQLLSMHLVSRDVSGLSAEECRQAAISSLAENLTDSVVAPLFYYALFGLAGAWVYRTINTADAMFGYRTPELTHFGWASARADDAANWLPARLTALAIMVAAAFGQKRVGLAQLSSEARKTPSPNGGWTMGAMALAVDIRLEKPSVYALNEAGRLPQAADFAQATRLSKFALTLVAAPLALLCYV